MNFFDLVKKFKKDVHFEAAAKDALRRRLFIAIGGDMREAFRARTPFFGRLAISISAASMLFVVGVGTSFAAEGSLPGDILYPVKININEKVVAAFLTSAEAKAGWEAKLAARRLEEITELVVKDGIKPEVKTALEDNFESHAQKARDGIREVEAEGKVAAAAGIASNLEGLLKTHGKVLSGLEAESTSSEKIETIRDMHDKVDEEIDNVSDARADLEREVQQGGEDEGGSQTKVMVAAEEKLKAAGKVMGEARDFLDSKKDKLDAQTVADAETKLVSADALVADANGKLQLGDYGGAFVLGNQAIRTAQEAKLLVNANAELNINIKISEPEGEYGDATSLTEIKEPEKGTVNDGAGVGAHLDRGENDNHRQNDDNPD